MPSFLPGVYVDDAITLNIMLKEYVPRSDRATSRQDFMERQPVCAYGISPLSEAIWRPYISSNKNPIQSVKQIVANVASMRRNARNCHSNRGW